MAKKVFFRFVLFFLWALYVGSLSAAPVKVFIKIGNGSLKINGKPGELSREVQNRLKLLETELLVDSNLSNKVLSSRIISIPIRHDFESETFPTLKSKILAKFDFKESEEPADQLDSQANKDEDSGFTEEEQDDDNLGGGYSSTVTIQGDVEVLTKGNSRVIDEGETVETVIVSGGSLTINGTVENLFLVTGDVNLGSTGKVSHDYVKVFGTMNVEQGGVLSKNKNNMVGAIADGLIQSDFSDLLLSWSFNFWWVLTKWIQVFIIFGLSLVLISYFKISFFRDLGPFWMSSLVGAAHAFLSPLVFGLLLISIIGIFLWPLYLTLIYLFTFLGYGIWAARLGDILFNRISFLPSNSPVLACFFLGMVVVEVLTSLPLIGFLFSFVFYAASFGVVTQIFYERFSRRKTRAL